MDLKTNLQNVIKGEVLDDDTTLTQYSQDSSVFSVKPQVIVFPKDSQDIKDLIEFVNKSKDKLSITPRSAGTDMSGGAINDSIIMDMTKHFSQIKEIGSDFAITQPGVFYRDFEKETLKHNLILPCYTASRMINTVGGMVANNSAGEKTLQYGQTERYVKKLKVILSDGNEYEFYPMSKAELDKKLAQKDFEGEVYKKVFKLVDANYDLLQEARPKVSKNSSGYLLWYTWDKEKQIFDMTKAFVGSQGTLGVITEITYQLVKPHTHSKLLVVFLKDLDHLAQIVNKILAHKPESFESYDDYTLRVALRFLPEVFKVFNAKNLVSLAWSFLPEVLMASTGGMPKLILMAEFTGDSEQEVNLKCLDAQIDLKEFKVKTRITKSEQETKKYWILRRESFNLLRHHSMGKRTAPFIDDVIVHPEDLPEFLPKLQEILKQYDLVYTIAGHVGNGNFHIIPLMDFNNPETPKIIPELSEKVYDLVIQYKGSMTAEHNDGMIRGPYLKKMYGEKVYEIFKELKTIFDPKDIFNPHKKIDATMDFSLKHIVDKS